MKNNLFKSLIAGVLAMTLIFGGLAIAEDATTQPEVSSTEAAEQQALSEAAKALKSARMKARQNAVKQEHETELKGYVEAGEMTQEQADLLLKSVEEGQGLKSSRQSGKKNAAGMDGKKSNRSKNNDGQKSGKKSGRSKNQF